MIYPREFFGFQIEVAQRIVARFGFSLPNALAAYTTFPNIVVVRGEWKPFATAIEHSADPLETTYEWYQSQHGHELPPKPSDAEFHGRPLFGCFYFVVRDEVIIRPHFVKNDSPGMRPLGHERVDVRRAELTRMFAYIKRQVPAATTVLGNSWLYNLAAYTRLFPPAYIDNMPTSDADEFNFLARWGQCYDSAWHPKAAVAGELLRRLETLDDLAQFRRCFPFQLLNPSCSCDAFFSFYGVD